MWEIDTSFVDGWLDSLEDDSADQVIAALTVLSDVGPTLGRPLVDTLVGSRHRNMKELRPGSSGRSELRVLFAFDQERNAILLVGGDKSGNWSKWYRESIPLADDLFDRHNERIREHGGRM